MSEKLTLPTENKLWNVEQGTIQFKLEKDTNGKERPEFYVQIIDQYGYQREWRIGLRHRPGNLEDLYWESHMYRHPGRRSVHELTKTVAMNMMTRFHYLLEKYPSLPFNPEYYEKNGKLRRARHSGFVHFSENVLDGADPSVKMMNAYF